MSGHPLYQTWNAMMTRCYNPQHEQFKDYGGRGITVCDRWHDVRLFIADIELLIGSRPPKMTLDRIDNDGGYGPGKVRWATRSEQRLNARRPHARVTSKKSNLISTFRSLASQKPY
jgi:hypothetical protein